jgi:hypothetical protein
VTGTQACALCSVHWLRRAHLDKAGLQFADRTVIDRVLYQLGEMSGLACIAVTSCLNLLDDCVGGCYAMVSGHHDLDQDPVRLRSELRI